VKGLAELSFAQLSTIATLRPLNRQIDDLVAVLRQGDHMRRRVIVTAVASTILAGTPFATDSAHAATERCHGQVATIVGTRGTDQLRGTPGDDVIAALGSQDFVDGHGGDDLICGGAGTDHLNGGAGDDVIYGGKDGLFTDDHETDRVGDYLRGGPGNDVFHPGADTRPADEIGPDSLLFDRSPHRMHVYIARGVARGDGRDTFPARGIAIVGSPFGDMLRGGPEADYLDGAQGPDILRGSGGDDRIIGDSGSHSTHSRDLLVGGPGNDAMSAVKGEDLFKGGPGDDVLDDIGRSADVMSGGRGKDLIIGQLWETDALQIFKGGPGRDHLSLLSNELNPTPDAATGTWDMRTGVMHFTLNELLDITASKFEKADFATWGASWTIDGTDGPNVVFASNRSTTFYGHGGDDKFMGSPDPDTFDGGDGTDRALSMGVDPGDVCISVEVIDYDDCD
jgi:Ca2+-binding RTX toxin-like protein